MFHYLGPDAFYAAKIVRFGKGAGGLAALDNSLSERVANAWQTRQFGEIGGVQIDLKLCHAALSVVGFDQSIPRTAMDDP